MAITFPASPSNGDVFTNSTTGVKYIYNATDGVWKTHIWPTNTDYLQLSGGTLTGNLSLGTNDLTAQDITTTGSVTVGNGLTVSDGNLVMAAGHGIDFSATANAAGMTSELLDDYEEGTWTPSNPYVTYTAIYGWYTKVGNVVHTWGRVTVPSNTNGNLFQINGLPYTVLEHQYAGGVAITNIGNGNDICPMYNANDTSIKVRNHNNTDYSLSFVSGKFLYFHGSYQTA